MRLAEGESMRRIALGILGSVVMVVGLTGCGQENVDSFRSSSTDDSTSGGPSEHAAVHLCRDSGAEAAEGLTSGTTELALVYSTSASDVATWMAQGDRPAVESDHAAVGPEHSAGQGGQEPESEGSYAAVWRREAAANPSMKVALCFFDATRVMAPGGPDAADTAYEHLLVVASENGPVHPIRAMTTDSPMREDVPQEAKRVYP